MSRPCWVGSLSFGLVHVPVRLYAAVEPKKVRFHLLHDADGARVQQRRICSADGEEVPYEHVVKGYELRRGQYVEVTRGELEAFEPKSSRNIDLEDFVEMGEIDPMYYAATYHVVPAVGVERQYGLLVAALQRSGRVGLGRMVMRHKGHLCVVRPFGRGLALSTLYYAEELVSQETLTELAVAGPRPSEQELEMVLRLIESQSTAFEPRRYHDTHRERLLSFLERRARAQAKLREPEPARLAAEGAEATAGKLEAFRRIEEGIAALRRGERRPGREARRVTGSQGALRFRQQAAREAREREGEGMEASAPRRDRDEPGRP
jgi:DNA end-binding protein Ku